MKISNQLAVEAKPFLTLSLPSGKELCLSPPEFELDGQLVSDWNWQSSFSEQGSQWFVYTSSLLPVCVKVELSSRSRGRVLRFRYHLSAESPVSMTKYKGTQGPRYFSCCPFSQEDGVWQEVQLAQYLPQVHSFVPLTQTVDREQYRYGIVLPGPLVQWESPWGSLLLGYEHGAEYPNHYLHFELSEQGISLAGSKGNYYHGQLLSPERGWTSCWFQAAFSDGRLEELHREYREFLLQLCPGGESRRPYLFYNTWNYQERDFNFKDKPYLSRMELQKVLKEIDAAHEMGIEVFVIDTGWYEKTGDWLVNRERFPDGLKQVRERLESYGMKLGLWFNPTVAARTSQIVREHPEYRMELDGVSRCEPVWETEESFGMCLCSDYAEAFTQKLISLYHDLGVRYFKWDGISQFGCNCAHHQHGGPENSPEERADCYSYQMGLRMVEIVQRLTEACPEAIVDFDVTEAGRFVGLGFLSAGKYFLVNNGPYAKDFDLPEQFCYRQKEPVRLEPYTNLFFYPGSARPRTCRTGIQYDFLVPSQLFLTHYLPDGDQKARENSLASLVLGGNGIWGDLEELSEEQRAFWRENLALYKKVREDAVKVPAILRGATGSSPEIYEKVNPETGRGLVAIFTCQQAEYCWDTVPLQAPPREVSGADRWEMLPNGAVRIWVRLPQDGARTVFLL